ncbi:TPA: queuosine precursor transporter [archaeon]|uniref:Probable queuosine precursor transporter n=1 Tax=Candidatus Naiadarchaeum limnaeum TaxID=2756139 RepID=A0A832XIN1_9ARCH|nr:queuosine precursor transporter [Candidatus Naiadarchaeum limnaeum]
MELSTEEKTSIFLALYVAGIIAANLAGSKLTVLFGKSVSVAILSLPITYIVLSAANEVFGVNLSRKYVLSAIVAQIAVLVVILVSLNLPAGPRQILVFGNAEESIKIYNTVFKQSGRIIIGSIIAFLTSQLYTIWAFDRIKIKMYGKFAWLRYNAATISGAFIDTFLFMLIAFYSGDIVFTTNIALNYFLFKVLVTIISTPFFYGGVWWLRPKKTPPEEPMRIAVRVPERRKA